MSDSAHDTTGPFKVVAYFDPSTSPENYVGSESFWAHLLTDHPATTDTHYAMRVDNLLVWAPFTLGDVVLVTANDDERLQVVALLERTPRLSLLIVVSAPADDPTGEAAAGLLGGHIAQACQDRGGRTERFSPGVISVQVPDDISDEDTAYAWLDKTLAAIDLPPGLEISVDTSHHPGDPMVVKWLDTSLAQALPDQTYTGPDDQAWQAAGDRAFAAALTQARADGQIPAWAHDGIIIDAATSLWQRDARVRAAIEQSRYGDVAIFAFRVSAPADALLPPLDRPLL